MRIPKKTLSSIKAQAHLGSLEHLRALSTGIAILDDDDHVDLVEIYQEFFSRPPPAIITGEHALQCERVRWALYGIFTLLDNPDRILRRAWATRNAGLLLSIGHMWPSIWTWLRAVFLKNCLVLPPEIVKVVFDGVDDMGQAFYLCFCAALMSAYDHEEENTFRNMMCNTPGFIPLIANFWTKGDLATLPPTTHIIKCITSDFVKEWMDLLVGAVGSSVLFAEEVITQLYRCVRDDHTYVDAAGNIVDILLSPLTTSIHDTLLDKDAVPAILMFIDHAVKCSRRDGDRIEGLTANSLEYLQRVFESRHGPQQAHLALNEGIVITLANAAAAIPCQVDLLKSPIHSRIAIIVNMLSRYSVYRSNYRAIKRSVRKIEKLDQKLDQRCFQPEHLRYVWDDFVTLHVGVSIFSAQFFRILKQQCSSVGCFFAIWFPLNTCIRHSARLLLLGQPFDDAPTVEHITVPKYVKGKIGKQAIAATVYVEVLHLSQLALVLRRKLSDLITDFITARDHEFIARMTTTVMMQEVTKLGLLYEKYALTYRRDDISPLCFTVDCTVVPFRITAYPSISGKVYAQFKDVPYQKQNAKRCIMVFGIFPLGGRDGRMFIRGVLQPTPRYYTFRQFLQTNLTKGIDAKTAMAQIDSDLQIEGPSVGLVPKVEWDIRNVDFSYAYS